MKRFYAIAVVIALTTLLPFTTGYAASREKISQEQLDSAATRIAERLETGSWRFSPMDFYGTNNVHLEFNNFSDNMVVMQGDRILVAINFIDARLVASAMTPSQKGRALKGAAAVARYGTGLPNYIKTVGTVTEKKVVIGKNSKHVTLDVKYSIDDSNVKHPSSYPSLSLSVDVKHLTYRLVFSNMGFDGTMEGNVTPL